MSGAKVWDYYLEGRNDEIRFYCETDALNTYLVYLRFQLMRGILDKRQYQSETDLLKAKLSESEQPHLREFLAAWRGNSDDL